MNQKLNYIRLIIWMIFLHSFLHSFLYSNMSPLKFSTFIYFHITSICNFFCYLFVILSCHVDNSNYRTRAPYVSIVHDQTIDRIQFSNIYWIFLFPTLSDSTMCVHICFLISCTVKSLYDLTTLILIFY